MPIKVPELTDAAVRKLTHGTVKGNPKVKTSQRKRAVGDPCTAYHAVGGVSGLLLQCRPPQNGHKQGSRSWILRTKVGDKRRDIGLGGYPDVSLKQAREIARDLKIKIRTEGYDPVAEKRAARSALIAEQAKAITFEEQAKRYVDRKSKEFKGRAPEKQRQRLEQGLNDYVLPFIGKVLMADLDRSHVIKVLKPIWETKNPTASRIRLTIERIYGMAKAEGIVTGNNPAEWKDNLKESLPAPEGVHTEDHHPTIGYERLPRFVELLQKRDTFPARATEFLILTAARPGEVRFAEWKEIDLENRVWIVPGHKIKGRKDKRMDHRVPLCDRAMEILESLPRLSEYVFPGYRSKPHMSENALNLTVKAIHDDDIKKGGKGFTDASFNRTGTAHGMRSCFKDFATEETNFEDAVSELALSHLDTTGTKAAYQRKQLIDKRRRLMAVYERYAYTGKLPKDDLKIVEMEAKRA